MASYEILMFPIYEIGYIDENQPKAVVSHII